jgi:hypothetical protein
MMIKNRILKIIKSTFDTIINDNILEPKFTTQTFNVNYLGNNPVPTGLTSHGVTSNILYNNSRQIIELSSSPGNGTTYSYSDGLIIGFSGSTNSFYTIDSISIDTNNNMTSKLLGANYYLDSNHNSIYGKIASWKFTYSNILNPVYPNRSLSTVLFLLTSRMQSRNIVSGSEWISYGANEAIGRHEKSNYQNMVDANNLIQSSVNLTYGDIRKWFYY